MSHTSKCKIDHPLKPKLHLHPVWAVVGSWAVTDLGLEFLGDHRYTIGKDQLSDESLDAHMLNKEWADGTNFASARATARKLHGIA